MAAGDDDAGPEGVSLELAVGDVLRAPVADAQEVVRRDHRRGDHARDERA